MKVHVDPKLTFNKVKYCMALQYVCGSLFSEFGHFHNSSTLDLGLGLTANPLASWF